MNNLSRHLKKTYSILRMNHQEAKKRATCGVIVIGDEVLNGSVRDTNSHFLCTNLHEMGIDVPRISVIRDDVNMIAKEVREFSQNYKYVITSGGIGPTHDDVTFEGVGKAFDEEVKPHPDLVEVCRQWFKTDDMSSPAMKLAHIPKSAKLLYGADRDSGKRAKFPIVSIRNVFVFPGVPHLLEKAFLLLANDVFAEGRMTRHKQEVYLESDEVSIADALNAVVKEHAQVKFGSYPALFHSYYRTRITAEGDDENQVNSAISDFRSRVPTGAFVEYDKTPTRNMKSKLESLQTYGDLWPKVESAIQVLKECYQRFRPENVVVCFNGGKDCTAVLHMAAAVLADVHPEATLHGLYVVEPRPFPQVTEFIEESSVRYNVQLERIPGPMKSALEELLKRKPHIEAAVMGTRRGDPRTDRQEAFSPTDSDWPKFIRVNPLLDWDYSQVWQFIRKLYLPYCNLYDRGYTSLGSVDNTVPNPLLYDESSQRYKSAYMLEDLSAERNGRL